MLRVLWRAGRITRRGAVLAGLVFLPCLIGSLTRVVPVPFLPSAAGAAAARSMITVDLHYAPQEIHVNWKGGQPIVRLGEESASVLGLPGGASWPAPVVYLVLPEGQGPGNVRAAGQDPVSLSATLAAATTAAATSGGVDDQIPEALGVPSELVYDGWMRGQHVVGVRLRPVTRDPLTRDIRLWQKVTLTLGLSAMPRPLGTVTPQRETAPAEESFERALKSLVANPTDVAVGSTDAGGNASPAGPGRSMLAPTSFSGDNNNPLYRPSLDGSAVSMVIITGDALVSEYQRLADWRTSTGNYTVIRTVNWIEQNYPEGVDLQDSIRRFIHDAVSRWGTGWVLLGGDTDIVPVRYGKTAYFEGEDIPADLYYQCLDRNWNENGNSAFGEGYYTDGPGQVNTGDDADILPDIWVARIPLSTPAGVKAVIDKTFQYERTPPLKNYIPAFLCMAEMLQPPNWNPGDLVLFDGAELGESAIANIPPGFRITRMYENHTDPRWAGVALPEEKNAVIDSINVGYEIVHHIGHGFRNNVSVGLGGKEIERTDADALTNKTEPFLFYGINCNSASFDFECIGEHFLANPNGGAFAYIGSTRFDFPGHGEDYQGAFYRNLFQPGVTLGEAHARQKLVRVADSIRDGADRWTQFTLVCLGDPLVQMRTQNPVALTVTRPESVPLGGNVTVSVSRAGSPLSGARVTLYRAGDLFATDTTNAAGSVTLACPAEQAGAVSLTATSLNSIPYSGSVQLTDPATTPYLSVTGLTIVDDPAAAAGLVGDNDGHLDPGETADLHYTVRNRGGVTANGVTLTFASGSGGLAVGHAVTDLAPLAPGASGSTPLTQSIRVTASSLVSRPTSFNGTLTLAWAGGSRVDPVVLNVGGVSLWVVEQSFVDDPGGSGSDGRITNGEAVQLTETLKNRGLSVARSVHVRLVSTDPRVSVNAGDVALGDIPAGATVVLPTPLAFTVSDTAGLAGLSLVVETGGQEVRNAVVDLVPPPLTTGLAAQPQSSAVALTWSRVVTPDLRGYAVYRAASEAGPFTLLNTVIDNPMGVYFDNGLTGFTRYFYQVAAQDQSGNLGPRSAVLTAATSFAALLNFPLEREAGTPASPVIHDLDGDGELEIIIGGEEIYAIHADGTEYYNGDADSRTLGILTNSGRPTFWGTPAVADVDNDGILELVGAGWNDGKLYVYEPDGSIARGWPRKIADVDAAGCRCSAVWASPCVADMDGDGHLEIFIPGGRYLYGFHDDGTEIIDGDQNPATVGVFADLINSFNYGSPAAADLDLDTRPEIVIGSRHGDLHVFKADGSEPAGWPKQFLVNGVAAPIISSPAIANLDGAANGGKPEIIVAVHQPRNKVEAINIDGVSPPGWPVGILLNQDFDASPTVGDLDLDGQPEVVMFGGSGRVQAWHGHNGQALFSPVDIAALDGSPNFAARGTPCLGDITGDGRPDIVMGTQTGTIWGVDATGQVLPGFPLRAQDNVEGGIVIWDVDGNGKNELLFGSVDKNLYVFETQGITTATSLPWPMFRHDQKNSGDAAQLVSTPVEPTLASFTAAAEGGAVRLDWRARDGAWSGWNVYREDARGELRLNAALLPARPRMTLRDETAEAGAALTYRIEGVDRAGQATRFAPLTFVVPDGGATTLLLRQNAPNPFRSATTIGYRVPEAPGQSSGGVDGARARVAPRAAGAEPQAVRLEVLDVQGRRVRLLVDTAQPPGDYSLAWDGRSDTGDALAAGLYFSRLRVAGRTQTQKMLLTR